MEKILISACLVGDNCKYDGKNNLTPYLDQLLEKYELVPFCPEVEGGLSTPRIPSERKDDRVINQQGRDVTKPYMKGAELAYNICLYLGIDKVILKERSPACGVKEIYDGTFTHKVKKGMGVTSEYLKSKGIRVISSEDIESFLNE